MPCISSVLPAGFVPQHASIDRVEKIGGKQGTKHDKKKEEKKLLMAIALRMPNMVGIFSSTEQMSFTRHHKKLESGS